MDMNRGGCGIDEGGLAWRRKNGVSAGGELATQDGHDVVINSTKRRSSVISEHSCRRGFAITREQQTLAIIPVKGPCNKS
jgi:hypothetical protein